MNWSRSDRVLRGGTEVLERATITTPRSELPQFRGEQLVASGALEDPIAAAFAAGVEKGRAEAREQLELAAAKQRDAELKALSSSLRDAVDALIDNRQALLDELFEDIGELVYELVRELVGVELSIAKEPARDAVIRALRVAPANTDLVVRVHPKAAIAAWELESLAPGRHVRVLEDETIEVNGCVLEVGSTNIDAQIGPALERLREALSHLTTHAHAEDEQ